VKVSEVMQRRVVTVAENEAIGRALQLMLWNDVRHLPVLRPDDERLTGVLSERDILRAHQQLPGEEVLEHAVAEFMTQPAEHIHPNADLADAAADLSTKKLGCLPVLDAGELVGIVAVEDVLAVVAQLPIPRPASAIDETVAAVMSREALAMREDDRVPDAAARMLRAGVRHLCVVDGEQRVLGIVSDRDLRSVLGDLRVAETASTLPAALAELRLGKVMTPNPRSVQPDAPLSEALDALLVERFGALPVVDAEERLCGIVSYVDLLRRLSDRVSGAA
jgi:acetoin utilization protein AcuB